MLTGPTGPAQQGGLPWTLDRVTPIFKLNLALRGVSRSQHRRYVTEGLPLPSADNTTMGRGTFPGSFGKGPIRHYSEATHNPLPGLGECVSLPGHIPKILQRLGVKRPKPPPK